MSTINRMDTYHRLLLMFLKVYTHTCEYALTNLYIFLNWKVKKTVKTVVLTAGGGADTYLEKDVSCWLPAHQLPQQVHCLKHNFDSILENMGPNCKSENSHH